MAIGLGDEEEKIIKKKTYADAVNRDTIVRTREEYVNAHIDGIFKN